MYNYADFERLYCFEYPQSSRRKKIKYCFFFKKSSRNWPSTFEAFCTLRLFCYRVTSATTQMKLVIVKIFETPCYERSVSWSVSMSYCRLRKCQQILKTPWLAYWIALKSVLSFILENRSIQRWSCGTKQLYLNVRYHFISFSFHLGKFYSSGMPGAAQKDSVLKVFFKMHYRKLHKCV